MNTYEKRLRKKDVKSQTIANGWGWWIKTLEMMDMFDRFKFAKLSKVKLFLPLTSGGSCASLYPIQTEESFTSGKEEQFKFLGQGRANISQKTKQFFLYSSNKTVY